MAGQHFNDSELLERVRKRDRRAQYALYHKYADAMYHTAIRMVHCSEDAQDILQESFVRVFNKIDRYRGDASLGAWIKRIVINTSINHIRKQQSYSELLANSVKAQVDEESMEAFNRSNPAKIHAAIKRLPKGCATVLNLYAFEGYTHKEISDILKISHSTSKTQYMRAKALLREILAENTIKDEIQK